MKDPCMLFYPADFLIGVAFMSMEERGKYITLLCYQQQRGHLTLDEMEKAVGDISDELLSKFTLDEDGKYYNRRADIEIERRAAYVNSRIANGMALKKKIEENKAQADRMGEHMPEHMPNDMPEHMEIRNKKYEISNKKTEKHKYGEYKNVLLTDEEYEKLKAEYPDLPARIERLSEYIASKGATYKSHYATIRSWAHKDDKEATAKTINKYRDFARRALASGVLPLPSEDDEEEGK